MGFLNQAVLKQKSADAAVGKHPLLQEGTVPQNVRQSYLQGCVLAVLERDNGEISPTARQEIARLGKSLELSDSDVNESISVVTALNSPEDQGQFLEELFSTLSEARYAQYFLSDFENHLKKNGQLSDDAKKTLDMFKDALARNGLSSRQDVADNSLRKDANRGVATSADLANRPNSEIRALIRAISIHEVAVGTGFQRIQDGCDVYSPDARTICVVPILHDPNAFNDPNSSSYIEDVVKREELVREFSAWNRCVQSDDFVLFLRRTFQNLIPGIEPVFMGTSVLWTLPDNAYRRSMSVLPCGYNMRGDELGCYICKGFCCDDKEIAWDEPIHEFDLVGELFWLGLNLGSQEDEDREVERVFGCNSVDLTLMSFDKGVRMRFPDGRIQEIKTYGDVYRYFSEHCEIVYQ